MAALTSSSSSSSSSSSLSGAEGDAATTGLHQLVEKPRQDFANYLDQLIDALYECFPEDAKLQTLRTQYKTCVVTLPDPAIKATVEGRIITSFHTAFRPHFEKFMAKDPSLFDVDTEGLPDYALAVKDLWPHMDDEMKSTVFDYLGLLHRNAVTFVMYSNVPPELTGAIQNIGVQMQQQSPEGAPPDMQNLSASVKDALSNVDMNDLCQSMMQNADAFSDVFSLAMNTMKALKAQQK